MGKEEAIVPLHKPDLHEMLFFFACGVVISVPLTLFIYQYTDTLLIGFDRFTITLVSTAIFAPLIEEFAKAYPLFYRHGETERSIFNLALLVGIGFALIEQLTYVLALGSSVLNRLPGFFFHPASTSIVAYGISKKQPLIFYLLAVALHFCNNFLVVTTPFPITGSILVVTATIIISWQLRKRTGKNIII